VGVKAGGGTLMGKLVVIVQVSFIVLNVTIWAAGGWSIHLLYAGFHTGLLAADALTWYMDRRLNREIMKEIETLTRNYDNQMSLFDLKLSDNPGLHHLFPKTSDNQEVTKND